MPPLLDSEYCWAHAPEHQDEAAAARRAGGQVKKKQGTLALAYDLNGLQTIPDIQRWIELAMYETLGLENSVMRNRVLMSGAQIAAKVYESGDLAGRLEALEATVKRDRPAPEPFEQLDDLEELDDQTK